MHGPNAENLTSTTVENICQVQSCKQIDPKLDCFLKRAGERFVMTSDPDLISKGDSSPNVKPKRSFLQFANEVGYFMYGVLSFCVESTKKSLLT